MEFHRADGRSGGAGDVLLVVGDAQAIGANCETLRAARHLETGSAPG